MFKVFNCEQLVYTYRAAKFVYRNFNERKLTLACRLQIFCRGCQVIGKKKLFSFVFQIFVLTCILCVRIIIAGHVISTVNNNYTVMIARGIQITIFYNTYIWQSQEKPLSLVQQFLKPLYIIIPCYKLSQEICVKYGFTNCFYLCANFKFPNPICNQSFRLHV